MPTFPKNQRGTPLAIRAGMRFISFVGVLLAVAGCAADVGSVKGAEQDGFDLYESKADSFGRPTEHGELAFGIPNEAALDGEAFYHAWDFTLSGEARVALRVELVTPNLDTVMYLYRRDADSGRWGRYIARNDDYEGSVASKLERELADGEYRVLVKGYKRELRGSFVVLGQCDGPGCVARACDLESYEPFPGAADASCGELLSSAVAAPVTQEGSAGVTLAERCSLPDLARRAVELYYSYWDGYVGWSEIEPYEDEPAHLDVSWSVRSDGAAYVRVDAGGDEDALDVIFDASGDVVAHYQHNQSPDLGLYCDDPVGVDTECGFLYLDATARTEAAERQGAEDVRAADAREKLERVAFLAYEEYARALDLSADATVSVEWTAWDAGEWASWETAARVTLSAEGQPSRTYELAAASTTQWLFVERTETDATFVCREL